MSSTLQVTDGTYTADVVGLYLGTPGNNTATAPDSNSAECDVWLRRGRYVNWRSGRR